MKLTKYIVSTLILTLLTGCASENEDDGEVSCAPTAHGSYVKPAEYTVRDLKAQPTNSSLVVSALGRTHFRFERITSNGSIITSVEGKAGDECIIDTNDWMEGLFIFNRTDFEAIGRYIYSDPTITVTEVSGTCEDIRNESGFSDTKCSKEALYTNNERLTIDRLEGLDVEAEEERLLKFIVSDDQEIIRIERD